MANEVELVCGAVWDSVMGVAAGDYTIGVFTLASCTFVKVFYWTSSTIGDIDETIG